MENIQGLYISREITQNVSRIIKTSRKACADVCKPGEPGEVEILHALSFLYAV